MILDALEVHKLYDIRMTEVLQYFLLVPQQMCSTVLACQSNFCHDFSILFEGTRTASAGYIAWIIVLTLLKTNHLHTFRILDHFCYFHIFKRELSLGYLYAINFFHVVSEYNSSSLGFIKLKNKFVV